MVKSQVWPERPQIDLSCPLEFNLVGLQCRTETQLEPSLDASKLVIKSFTAKEDHRRPAMRTGKAEVTLLKLIDYRLHFV